jgi:chemotaxis response regulator CheB
MAGTRVLLVDDESLVRRTLKQILTNDPDMELVARPQQATKQLTP